MLEFREMTIDDYEQSIELWRQTEGLGLSEADSKESIQYYLNRNQGLSFVCLDHDQVIGTILCGHDGRRGFLYHVAVNRDYRGQSVGKRLVEYSLNKLRIEGIDKCHIMVIAGNEPGMEFWSRVGWIKREGILLYSRNV